MHSPFCQRQKKTKIGNTFPVVCHTTKETHNWHVHLKSQHILKTILISVCRLWVWWKSMERMPKNIRNNHRKLGHMFCCILNCVTYESLSVLFYLNLRLLYFIFITIIICPAPDIRHETGVRTLNLTCWTNYYNVWPYCDALYVCNNNNNENIPKFDCRYCCIRNETLFYDVRNVFRIYVLPYWFSSFFCLSYQ